MGNINPGDLVSFEISVNGSAISDTIMVKSIYIEQAINRISNATISVFDGNPADGNFPVSESDTFLPGNKIEIKAGYDGNNEILFKGIITKQTIRADNTSESLLEIECKDKAIKMTVGRKSAVYSNIKDSDVFGQLIADAGLLSEVDSTAYEIAELVQYYTSDWDFMLSRAEVNSMVVSTMNGKVAVFNPTKYHSTPLLTLTYGKDLYSFNAELNSVSQLANVQASTWDYKNKNIITEQASTPSVPSAGNISSRKLSQVIGLTNYELQTAANISDAELKSWADAQMLKSALAKITGGARFQGTSVVQPGKYIILNGLSARFNGNHFISSVRHDIADGNWITDVKIGLSTTWFVQENDVEAPTAAGLIPGIHGLFNGTVKQITGDPDAQKRILVEVALFNDTKTGIWARLANMYATDGQNDSFLPETGDEVLLGFLNQDPRYPVILGSMENPKKIKPKKKGFRALLDCIKSLFS